MYILYITSSIRNPTLKTTPHVIDDVKNIIGATNCQKECQKHPECQFWTYHHGKKKCWRQTIKAPSKRNCPHCRSGPRLCSHIGTISFDRNWNNEPIAKYDGLLNYLNYNEALFLS